MRFFKEQQYYMLQRVKNLLAKKKEVLCAQAPVLKKLIPEYFEKFDVIFKLITGKLKTTVIDTSQKNTAKQGLIDIILKLVAVLRAHHSSDDSNAMPEEAGYTRSKLNKSTVEDLIAKCDKVIAEVKKVNNLRDYNISSGDVKEAEAYLDEYKGVKSSPQRHRKEIAKQTVTINKGIRTCIIFLENKIDPVMLLATQDNMELLAHYNSFRKVMPRGPGNISDKEASYRRSRKPKKGRISKGKSSATEIRKGENGKNR